MIRFRIVITLLAAFLLSQAELFGQALQIPGSPEYYLPFVKYDPAESILNKYRAAADIQQRISFDDQNISISLNTAEISGQWFISYQNGKSYGTQVNRFLINRGYININCS